MGGLSYSIHLGNDKNKTKKAKESAKNNNSKTTSLSNNAIQNATQLSKANNHNLRKYDNQNEHISIIYGTNNLVNDVKNLYINEFENARLEYNNSQKRDDRKIENYFEHISKNSNRDLACELIIELGDMSFWQYKTKEYCYKMSDVFKEQIEDLVKIVPAFKLANATIHFDESSPHLHIIGIPVKDGYKNGMKKQVGKSLIFTKESLSNIQDKMRTCCIKSFNKMYNLNYELKEKDVGRNVDISVSKMKNYTKLKQEQEKNKLKLNEANSKTDNLNNKTANIELLVKELKPAKLSKNNYIISESNISTLTNYITDVKDTTNSIRSINSLTRIMRDYEKDLREHDNIVSGLTYENELKDKKINKLTDNLNQANNTIDKLKEKVNFLQEQLTIFKGLWQRICKYFQNKVLGRRDKDYEKITDDLYNAGVFTDNETNHIKHGNGLKTEINKKNDFELK